MHMHSQDYIISIGENEIFAVFADDFISMYKEGYRKNIERYNLARNTNPVNEKKLRLTSFCKR